MNKFHHLLWKVTRQLLVVAVALVSTACSGRSPSPVAPTPDHANVGDERGVITFAGYEYQREYFEALMKTFHEQHPDITVEFVDVTKSFSDDGDWSQDKYLRSLAQSADTFFIQGPYSLDLSGYFRDLRPLYESDPSFQPDDFWPGILTACEDNFGNMVGLPLITSITGIFYDQAAFDAAGLPAPEPGWTWDDFQKSVSSLAEKNGSQTKYGFYDQWDLGSSLLGPIVNDHLRSNGGEVDAAALLEEIGWYIDLARAGMLSGVKLNEDMTEEEWAERMKLFEDKALRPVMWIDSLISYVSPGDGVSDPNNPFFGMAIDQYSFAPFPISTDGSSNQTSRSIVECAAVSAGSTNPRAAWEWLNFLSKHWIVNDSSEVYEISRSPSRRSVADSSGYWDLLPAKAVPAVRFALEHGSYDTVYFDRFGEINVAIAKSIVENADFVQAYEAAYAARPEDTPTPPQDNSPIVVATPLAPLPEGVTAIKYYFTAQNPNENNTLNTLIEQYNQQSTDTRVTLVTEFHGDPGNNWISSMASNFDCFTGGAPYWEGLDATQLLSLNTLMSSEPASFNNDYSQEMINQFSQEGNLYGLPATSQVMMMAYNADLLTQRGLPMPASDWTFDDFIGMASAVASTSDTDPSYGFLFSPYEEFLAIGQGTKWIDFESNPVKVDFNSPEMLEHLRWLSKLEQDRVLFNQESNWEEMNAIMSAGQLAFWIASSGDQATWFYGSGQEPQYKIGMAPLPQTPVNNPMASWSNDRGHYISAQAQDPRACWDWIKFLSEQPNLLAGVPARRSIAESPAWEAWVGKDVASAYRTALENIQPVDQIEIDPKIQPVLWPLNQWKSQVVLAALAGEELQPLLIAQQEKADHYIDCALSLDLSQSMDQLNEGILACLRQADPEGGW